MTKLLFKNGIQTFLSFGLLLVVNSETGSKKLVNIILKYRRFPIADGFDFKFLANNEINLVMSPAYVTSNLHKENIFRRRFTIDICSLFIYWSSCIALFVILIIITFYFIL